MIDDISEQQRVKMPNNRETLYWSNPPLDSRWTWQNFQDGSLKMIDQTLLPTELKIIDCQSVESVWEAIKKLRVRGAPAIGIAAAYGVCVGLQKIFRKTRMLGGLEPDREDFFAELDRITSYLAESRPTAVNLFWALDRMTARAKALRDSHTVRQIAVELLKEAVLIHEEDRVLCRKMGKFGAELVKNGDGLLTHCNAGGLATADYGTALAVFFTAQEEGKNIHVYADETRPLLQGARLTAWELREHEIPVTLLCDSMAALVMRQGKINAVFVGADRIAANGDTANKIGTYSVAVNAAAHNIPFYVVAPFSTFDLTLENGDLIPIELRDPEEVRNGFGRQTAPCDIDIYNPAFDVTPARLIRGIVTEKGIISPVNKETIAALKNSPE